MRSRVLLWIAIGIFIFLSLWNVFGVQKTCWFDEAFSIETVNKGVQNIDFAAHDVHPPLSYLLLSGWMGVRPTSLVGQCDWGRMLSVVFGCIFLFAVYWGVKRFLYGDGPGYVALLFAMTPTYIHFGTEARMYVMVVALVALAWAALMRWRFWGLVVACAVLFVLPSFHYFAVLAVIPLVLSYVLFIDSRERECVREGVSVLAVSAGAGALLAYALFASSQIARSDGMWFGKSTVSSLPSAVSYSIFPPQYDLVGTVPMVVSVLVLCVIVYAMWWAVFKRKDTQLRKLYFVSIVMMAVPALVIVAIPMVNLVTGFQFGNIYHHRMVLVVTWLIPLGLYTGIVAAAQGRERGKSLVVACVILLLFLVGTYMSYGGMGVQTGHKELKGTIEAMPCDGKLMVHESPFSALSAKVMSEDRGCPHEYIIVTNLTVREGHTSGFDVVPSDKVVYLFEEGWEETIPEGEMWYFKAGKIPHAFGVETVVHVEDGLNLTYVVR